MFTYTIGAHAPPTHRPRIHPPPTHAHIGTYTRVAHDSDTWPRKLQYIQLVTAALTTPSSDRGKKNRFSPFLGWGERDREAVNYFFF